MFFIDFLQLVSYKPKIVSYTITKQTMNSNQVSYCEVDYSCPNGNLLVF